MGGQATFGQSATKDDIRTVAEFFHRGRFARLGAIVSVDTAFADELSTISTVAMVLNRVSPRLRAGPVFVQSR
jgi:hypothetical protein